MPRGAVFLDRDGTINEDPGYLSKIEQFIFLPQVVEGLKLLQELGFPLVVITNQSGIARRYFTPEDLDKVHNYMIEYLRKEGVELAGIYYCPHHPEKGLPEYVQSCSCRKPGAALLKKAAQELDLDLAASFMIGDKASDLGAGYNAGCQSILVLTGEGEKTLAKKAGWKEQPSHIAENLFQAACWVREQLGRGDNSGKEEIK